MLAANAAAQNWSFDARKVGLGSPTGSENLAISMIEDEREYRTIVLPFGLIQVLRNFKKLNPSDDEFDFVRTIEFAAAPIHYTIGRDSSDSETNDFIVDIRNGALTRDLNDYKGFTLVNQPAAAGLATPKWGRTFRVRQGPGGSFHGVYVGAGPYISMRTAPIIDEQLIGFLSAGERVYPPNSQFSAFNTSEGQIAMAVAGGYRGRRAWPLSIGRGSDREGLYLAANYNYLHGFRYEDVAVRARIDTDPLGLLTVNPFLPPPLFVSRVHSGSGTGMAIDVGVGAVVYDWEFGFGVNGLGNRITWTDVQHTTYFHQSLLTGNGDLTEGPSALLGDLRVELPVDYRANVGYDVERWGVLAEFGRGYQGTSFHGGGEYRLGLIDVRGGAVYSRELWNPAAGVGYDLSPGMALDVALYSNSANVERKRNPAIAVSLRFNR
jgi:hypothetical protein